MCLRARLLLLVRCLSEAFTASSLLEDSVGDCAISRFVL